MPPVPKDKGLGFRSALEMGLTRWEPWKMVSLIVRVVVEEEGKGEALGGRGTGTGSSWKWISVYPFALEWKFIVCFDTGTMEKQSIRFLN